MIAEKHKSFGKKWAKRLFQLLVLSMVAWGVWHSIRKSTRELGRQQIELNSRAQQLREQADASNNIQEQRELRAEAEQLTRKAREFWQAEPLGLCLAGACYALAMIPPCLFWRRCLIQLEQTSHLSDVVWAYFYGNLGKYFPGKAMVIVLRLAALQRQGVLKTATTMTIFMETLTMMSVGGAVAALCLILLNIDWRLTLLAIALLISTFLPTAPPVLRFLLPRLQRGVDADQLQRWAERISWPLFFRAWATLSLGWILNGLSLMFVLRGIPSADLATTSWSVLLLSCCGACALAVVLGFVSLIPSGAGVREVVILTVLEPVAGPTAAMCCALWLRVVWLFTELIVVGALRVLRMLDAREPAPAGAASPNAVLGIQESGDASR